MLSRSNRLFYSTAGSIKNIVIVGAARTPVGSFVGALSAVSATDLGSIALREAVRRSNLNADEISEVIMGNVLSAGLGQAPARQVALKASLPTSAVCTTVNKLCASGLKSISLGCQSIQLGHHGVVAAGGMESMSNVPFMLPSFLRGRPLGLGHQKLIDGILGDGLIDSTYLVHMGECGEETALKYRIGREEQDAYATRSYERARMHSQSGFFKQEIVPVTIKDKTVEEDEEHSRFNPDKFSSLKPVFKKEGGTITAANASKNSDGASAVVLMDEQAALSRGIKPLARFLAFADAECGPKKFTVAPSLAVPLALKRAKLSISDISLFEINEAFSVVALANQKILSIDDSKLNIAGGAVAIGHPVGSSGARILITLVNLLKTGELGCAAICNGGGGATAAIVEKL